MAFTEQTLELDSTHISNLFGQFDCYLKKLERAFGTQIIDRDGTVHIRGEQSAVAHTAAVFTELQELARRGNQIQEQNVDYAIAMHMENQENTLLEIDGDLICHTVSGKPVKPKTLGQKQYVDAIREKMIVFGLGPAGTGKTYLAMAMAITAFKNNEVERIILTRPAIEAGEKLGFLPGDLQSKVDPYLRPLYDALFDMLGAETYQKYLERGNIEVAPLAYMRGRTLKSMFLLCDECQNMSIAQHLMILTRLGEGSKMVLTGDVTQIDLPSPQDSGLERCADILEGIDDIEVIRLTGADVVRHKLVGKIITAFENNKAAPGQPAEKKPGQPTQKPAYRNNNRFARKK